MMCLIVFVCIGEWFSRLTGMMIKSHRGPSFRKVGPHCTVWRFNWTRLLRGLWQCWAWLFRKTHAQVLVYIIWYSACIREDKITIIINYIGLPHMIDEFLHDVVAPFAVSLQLLPVCCNRFLAWRLVGFWIDRRWTFWWTDRWTEYSPGKCKDECMNLAFLVCSSEWLLRRHGIHCAWRCSKLGGPFNGKCAGQRNSHRWEHQETWLQRCEILVECHLWVEGWSGQFAQSTKTQVSRHFVETE